MFHNCLDHRATAEDINSMTNTILCSMAVSVKLQLTAIETELERIDLWFTQSDTALKDKCVRAWHEQEQAWKHLDNLYKKYSLQAASYTEKQRDLITKSNNAAAALCIARSDYRTWLTSLEYTTMSQHQETALAEQIRLQNSLTQQYASHQKHAWNSAAVAHDQPARYDSFPAGVDKTGDNVERGECCNWAN